MAELSASNDQLIIVSKNDLREVFKPLFNEFLQSINISTTGASEKEGQNQFVTMTVGCDMLKCSRPTFNKLRKKGLLTDYHLGRTVRFKRDELFKAMESLSNRK